MTLSHTPAPLFPRAAAQDNTDGGTVLSAAADTGSSPRPVEQERGQDGRGEAANDAALLLDFYVFGRPAQQGSKSATIRGGKPIMFEDNKRTEGWRALVVSAARAAMPAGWERIPRDVGVGVSIVFTFDVPVSAPKRRRYWQTTRTSGDVEKLIRSTHDALTAAGVWVDDSQVVRLLPPFGKFNVGEPEALATPGAHVRVYRLGGGE